MTPKYKTYPKYKSSGVDWLGNIPDGWQSNRLRSWFVARNTKVSDKIFQPLSVTKKGVKLQLDSSAKSKDGDNRKLVKEGDFVINSRSDRKGSSGISPYDGSVSLIYSVLKPLEINTTYSNYLLRNYSFIEEFYRVGKGIVADLWTTRYEEMKNIKIAVPPLHEQEVIANFLDDKTEKIDRAIKQKEQLIELLKERKQIIIQDAVTKGLDPSVKMKDSGVEWIGDIPAHWEVKRLKYVGKVVLGKMLCPTNKGNYYLKPYLKSKNIQWMKLELSEVDEMWFSKKELSQYKLRTNDLILTEGGEIGKICIWNDELEECYIQNSAHKITIDNYNPYYYLYKLYLCGKMGVLDSIVNRVSIGHLTREKLVNVLLAVPPIYEQEEIVKHIEGQSSKIDKAIKLQQTQIDKLKEYKSILIDNAVTGKIKVV